MSKVRCAIYTRKSSEEGLEQDFNSLHAQREACAAYILSQASEGWSLLPGDYDDGGLSGGTLQRPALQRLLTDIEAGKLDTVVVYKVDRLTRSLLDFAKLVDTMDKAGVSFVSVTQSFNTTTSMGRLTLNMLLSFAQFEREVTAERIRDKIAASKARGMWMGGIPPLGYEPDGRSLKIVEEHAELVRTVFRRYLETGNVRLLGEQFEREKRRSPTRVLSTGKRIGGTPLTRGQIYKLLSNPVYVGEVHHRGQVYQGKHSAIIDRATWEAVKEQLRDNAQGSQRFSTAKVRSLLAGKLFDKAGEPLVASHATKGKVRYRYYVSRKLQFDAAANDSDGLRIPALELEKAVALRLAQLVSDPLRLAAKLRVASKPAQLQSAFRAAEKLSRKLRNRDFAAVNSLIDRIVMDGASVRISVDTSALSDTLELPSPTSGHAAINLELPFRLSRRGSALRIIAPDGRLASSDAGDPALIALLLRARGLWERLQREELTVTELSRAESLSDSWVTKLLRLNFLAPDLVQGILKGTQPDALTANNVTRFGTLPTDWVEQRILFCTR